VFHAKANEREFFFFFSFFFSVCFFLFVVFSIMTIGQYWSTLVGLGVSAATTAATSVFSPSTNDVQTVIRRWHCAMFDQERKGEEEKKKEFNFLHYVNTGSND
jgi:hypothetical protein